ncbi:hypothetical protein ES703_115801 [subsurface metagenome]
MQTEQKHLEPHHLFSHAVKKVAWVFYLFASLSYRDLGPSTDNSSLVTKPIGTNQR